MSSAAATPASEPAAEPAATLRSVYRRRPADTPTEQAGPQWFGTFDLTLDVAAPLEAGMHLVVWCSMLLEPTEVSAVRVVDRLAGHLVLEPVDVAAVAGSTRWSIPGLRSRFPARHANDGPEAAYMILPSGEPVPVEVVPAERAPTPAAAGDLQAPVDVGTGTDRSSVVSDRPPLVPFPTSGVVGDDEAEHTDARSGADRRVVHLTPTTDDPVVEATWGAVGALAQRLGANVFSDDASGLPLHVTMEAAPGVPMDVPVGVPMDVPVDEAVGVPVDEAADEAATSIARLAGSGYRLQIEADVVRLSAPSADALRHGLVTLAQWAANGMPTSAEVDDAPVFEFRGVHLDVARQWYEPQLVERLIDLAAWRKFSHVHLHLTDDEAWRFPVAGYPELSEAGTRGHGLPLPPLCASGAGAYGRSYSASEIGRWVERAAALGLVLVPEVDVPGHCHAALVAVPVLRDPHDSSTAVSVQGYPNNVLVPGHPETEKFLRAVFTSLAELFPHSPVLHIGGDEVPAGAWAGSPFVAAYAEQRGLSSKREVESSFHRELARMIREETGRDVAMWEEAALAGVEPGAYAVSWTSPDAARRVGDAGHRVVAAPGQAYYLDMATSREWELPGACWAGNVSLETTCAFDPFVDAANDLYGVQACIWSEHVVDADVLDALVFPRLDAVAERAWTGRIEGGPASLATRADHLPTFTRNHRSSSR